MCLFWGLFPLMLLDIWRSVLLGAVLKKWRGKESYTSCLNEVWHFSMTIIRWTWDLFHTRWCSCIFTVTRILELALCWFFEVLLLKNLFTVTRGWSCLEVSSGAHSLPTHVPLLGVFNYVHAQEPLWITKRKKKNSRKKLLLK